MRVFAVSLALVLCLTLSAQEKEKKKGQNPFAHPKNLKVLTAEALPSAMAAYRVGLGVKCTHCHVEGDFASDENPKKNTARAMIRMLAEINAKFPDGKAHVSCYTCHRGETEPKMTPPVAQ